MLSASEASCFNAKIVAVERRSFASLRMTRESLYYRPNGTTEMAFFGLPSMILSE